MKNFNSDSSSALSRFAKDKRLRTTKTKDERRETREGFKSERPKRASFNPNFTDDNRPKRGVENRKRKTENRLDKSLLSRRETRDERRERVSKVVASHLARARVTKARASQLPSVVIQNTTLTKLRVKSA